MRFDVRDHTCNKHYVCFNESGVLVERGYVLADGSVADYVVLLAPVHYKD